MTMAHEGGDAVALEQMFARGVTLHRQNQLSDAMAVYEQVLRAMPSHAGALHHVGIISFQTGNHNIAAGFIRSALALAPSLAPAHLDLGNTYKELGRFAEALDCYEQAGRLDPSLPDLHYNRATTLQAMKRHEEALRSYDIALAANPEDIECHNNRGVVLKELGRFDDALASYNRAIALDPRYVDAHNNSGNVHKEMGQFDVALQCYDQALQLSHSAEAHFNRGTALQALDQSDSAIESYTQAIKLNPAFAKAYNNRATALYTLDRPAEALRDSEIAVSLSPGYAEAHKTRGIVLFGIKRVHEALDSFKEAIRLDPQDPEAHDKCGVAYRDLKQPHEAMACHDRALALGGERPGTYLNRGNVLRDLGEMDAAITAYEHALEISPGYADAYVNLGTIYDALGRRADARASYDRAIALKPEFALAHWNRSLLDLQEGNFADGWLGYEWRWKTASQGLARERREFTEPLWRGHQDLDGKTILLYGEQGLGDTLQFCRYAQLVAARGAEVILEVPGTLCDLMRSQPGVHQVVARGTRLPPFDFQCPLLSLPLAFGTGLDSIPAFPRYLAADPDKSAQWARRLGQKSKLRVGIVWSGNPVHLNDHNRSIDFAKFAPLLAADVQFVVLQKEIRPIDRVALEAHPDVLQFSGEIGDFSDTAALCDALDLVVTVDTSAAHLAAALGKPTWVLLPLNSDWRWLRERSDSPWYPSVRLYRQPASGEWEPVLEGIAADLAQFIAGAAAP
ncbi:tetratricopeptide repeat protein [Massilia sp. LXY-6]|uniref:tetratricopeptide repeat protein n=1 Tax=Massilia sp. LXY-6 TaxID=3379823 RepID=UPI003EE05700